MANVQKIYAKELESHGKEAHEVCVGIINKLENDWLKGKLEDALFESAYEKIIKDGGKDLKETLTASLAEEERKLINAENLSDTAPGYFKNQLLKKNSGMNESEAEANVEGWMKMVPS